MACLYQKYLMISYPYHMTLALTKLMWRAHCHSGKPMYLEDNILEAFTSERMKKNFKLWDTKQIQNSGGIKVQALTKTTKAHNYHFELTSDQDQIEILFQNCLDTGNVDNLKSLVTSCVYYRRSPAPKTIMNCLRLLSQNGETECICEVKNLCSKCHPEFLKIHSNFHHFEAEAIWIKGDVSKALELFNRVYRENVYLRRNIRLMLKYLICDIVSKKSEAVLWIVIKFSESLLNDFQDFYPLTCVWQSCFLSEWFTDQCIALELLERNDGLCESVVGRIPYVVFISLQSHRTEVVYRLLEILLKYKLKEQYSTLLITLLDYQFHCRDLQSCTEIIRWAMENKVELPRNHCVKLINLLLSERGKTPIAAVNSKAPKQQTKYSLKF